MSTPLQPESNERRAALQVAEQTHSLLNALFQATERTYYSEQSLQIILDRFGLVLTAAVREGREAALLTRWEERLPVFRDRLHAIAADTPMYLQTGEAVAVMREWKANALVAEFDDCLRPAPPPDYQ